MRKKNLRKKIFFLRQSILIAFAAAIWSNFLTSPAQAQFFKKAEDFFKTSLTQGLSENQNSTLAISLIFNILRAIYLLYIAVSLINIINAVRKDEDWQSVARIPLLVIIAVTIADVLTGFIIGGS